MLCQSKCTDHQELPQFSILHIECNVFILPMNDAYILQNQDRLLYTYDIFFQTTMNRFTFNSFDTVFFTD